MLSGLRSAVKATIATDTPGIARTAALAQCKHSRDDGGDEQQADTGEQHAQPPVGTELLAAFVL